MFLLRSLTYDSTLIAFINTLENVFFFYKNINKQNKKHLINYINKTKLNKTAKITYAVIQVYPVAQTTYLNSMNIICHQKILKLHCVHFVYQSLINNKPDAI